MQPMIYWARRALTQKKKKRERETRRRKLSWNTTRAISTHQEDSEPTYAPAATFSAVTSQLGVVPSTAAFGASCQNFRS